MARALVAGAGGFIGGHLVGALVDAGHEVRAVDSKSFDEWHQRWDVEEVRVDLRDPDGCAQAVAGVDRVFNLASDMGGMGFIEHNRAACMLSVVINSHLIDASRRAEVERYFFASSACVYPSWSQATPDNQGLRESDAYPADPENGYGWEKLFSERMCRHFSEDFGLATRVARYHNVYGPHGTWEGGREKAPAAISRKVAEAKHAGTGRIEVWGDGQQTRTFTHIDDCVAATLRIMDSEVSTPLNVGSDELVSVDALVEMVCAIADVELEVVHLPDEAVGVRGRNSDNTMIDELLGWVPQVGLADGMASLYQWVELQMLGRQ